MTATVEVPRELLERLVDYAGRVRSGDIGGKEPIFGDIDDGHKLLNAPAAPVSESLTMTRDEVIRIRNTGCGNEWPKVWNRQLNELCEVYLQALSRGHESAGERVHVQACRPEDRAMLATPAGQEMVKAAVAAMDESAGEKDAADIVCTRETMKQKEMCAYRGACKPRQLPAELFVAAPAAPHGDHGALVERLRAEVKMWTVPAEYVQPPICLLLTEAAAAIEALQREQVIGGMGIHAWKQCAESAERAYAEERSRVAELARERDAIRAAWQEKNDENQDNARDAIKAWDKVAELTAELARARADERERCAQLCDQRFKVIRIREAIDGYLADNPALVKQIDAAIDAGAK